MSIKSFQGSCAAVETEINEWLAANPVKITSIKLSQPFTTEEQAEQRKARGLRPIPLAREN